MISAGSSKIRDDSRSNQGRCRLGKIEAAVWRPDNRLFSGQTVLPSTKGVDDSDFGLSAEPIANDLPKAFDLSLRIESGMLHTNDCSIIEEPQVPFALLFWKALTVVLRSGNVGAIIKR